jgi:hypothetical protein
MWRSGQERSEQLKLREQRMENENGEIKASPQTIMTVLLDAQWHDDGV